MSDEPGRRWAFRVPAGAEARFAREGGKGGRQADDRRTEGRHDRDRVYYSNAFRRLAGVTQVVTPTLDGLLTHNRLTHSLKVAQVARSVAEALLENPANQGTIEALGGLDADVVEAASLAHDLGHPPFGHIGEEVLDEFARDTLKLEEGFEGNAQSFRICTRLEPRGRYFNGMSLSAAARAGILKYPWQRAVRRDDHETALKQDKTYKLRWSKFGVYAEDLEAFKSARAWYRHASSDAQTLEAAIMDLADDVTYALHDLEDFHTAGILDVVRAKDALDQWQTNFADMEDDWEVPEGVDNVFEHLRVRLRRDFDRAFDHNNYGEAVRTVRSHLESLLVAPSVGHRRAAASTRRFISNMIGEFVAGVTIQADEVTPSTPPATLNRDHWHQIQVLKDITKQFIIARADIAVLQRGQQALLRELLCDLCEWCSHDADKKRLPLDLQESLTEAGDRAIIDYVSGLSDHQAVALHRSLRGLEPIPVVRKPWT